MILSCYDFYNCKKKQKWTPACAGVTVLEGLSSPRRRGSR